MKPMLAETWDVSKLKFPVLAMPKIDGVRGLNMLGKLTGRSLKPFKNKHVTGLFSHSILLGLDGEFAAEKATHPDLCRMTTSALGTITGMPYLLWHLFDYVTAETANLPYWQRLRMLGNRVGELHITVPHIAQHLRTVSYEEFATLEGLMQFHERNMELGYEGTILRDPNGVHKNGRSTVLEGGYLRIKDFADAEAVVTALHEGETNNNEAQINELGNTFRTSHQENKSANGLVGTLSVKLLAPIAAGDKVFEAGETILIAAGKMTSEERAFYLLHPGEIVGKVVKFQYFPHGVKDKLRFPTFQSIRMKEDMS